LSNPPGPPPFTPAPPPCLGAPPPPAPCPPPAPPPAPPAPERRPCARLSPPPGAGTRRCKRNHPKNIPPQEQAAWRRRSALSVWASWVAAWRPTCWPRALT
ncbi:MAG: hypothetical protein F4X16_07360, partial [Caldilineaceae bacterium SB0661_bin_34]|nr:hypothetical protein [Caldilineaceae bacterium SB0661_bin_34]